MLLPKAKLLAISYAGVVVAAQVCYDNALVQQNTLGVCDPTAAVSQCCPYGQTCYSNGLCRNETTDGYFVNGCTNTNGGTDLCAAWSRCHNLGSVGGTQVVNCRNNNWCCYGFSGCDCNNATQVFSLAQANILTTLPATAPTSTSSSASATSTNPAASSTAPSSSNGSSSSSSVAAGVGGGIGGAAAVAIIVGVVWFCLRKKKRQQAAQDHSQYYAPQNQGQYHAPSQYQDDYSAPPKEYPTAYKMAEPQSGSQYSQSQSMYGSPQARAHELAALHGPAELDTMGPRK